MALYKKTEWTVVCWCFLILLTANVYGQFAGGSGTEGDPYLVETVEHLDRVRDYENRHFSQIADIDLNESQYNDGGNWLPVDSFSGVYDGSGYNIANLYINRPDENGQALFRSSQEDRALIKNVNLIEVNVTGLSDAAGLIGRGRNIVIENVFVSGVVMAANKAGGIAGTISGSRIEDSHSDTDVTGGSNYMSGTGGIVGSISSTTIKRSINTGSVSGLDMTGGIAGYVSSSSRIENCYSTGSVRGVNHTGGLTGKLYGPQTVHNCYSSGAVRGIYNTGGLIGSALDGESVENSFWNRQTSGQESSAGGTPLDVNAMTDILTFRAATWDIDTTWNLKEGRTFPYLRWEEEAGGHTMIKPLNLRGYPSNTEVTLVWEGSPEALKYNVYRNREKAASVTGTEFVDSGLNNLEEYLYHVTAVYEEGETSRSNYAKATPNPGFSSGEGTAENPYTVEQPEELDYVRFYGNVYFRQTADIDLADLRQNETGNRKPIGCTRYPFKGRYDGGGYTISNLIIHGEGERYQGLFGYVIDAKLANINLKNVDVIGHTSVGALAGRLESSIVDNSSSEGKIRATANHVGGLVGESFHSSIISNSNTSGIVILRGLPTKMADVSREFNENIEDRQTSNRMPRFFVAERNQNKDALLIKPQPADRILIPGYKTLSDPETMQSNGHCSGGLAGLNFYNSRVLNCFSTAEVDGVWRVGGLVGDNSYGGIIANSYSTGNVTGVQSAGSLVSFNIRHYENYGYGEGGVYNSYSTGKVTNHSGHLKLMGGESDESVYNTYWNSDMSERNTPGSGSPRNTEQMTYPYDPDTFVGWDFDEVWAADVDYEVNNGYPYLRDDASVAVEEDDIAIAAPKTVEMKIYPNPFNPNAVIAFNLPQRTTVAINIFNVRGQLVKSLVDNEYPAGEHKASWDGTDDRGTSQPSGVYFTQIETPGYRQVKRIMLLK